ncbi:TQO small subunit DoxD [Dyella mobilis]|uniref:Quinol oxidase n=1 Tax=Dyella mobilis TaxID=1849582 RepID=A0ABS2KF58_9GAMM|nr:TQO small subunit DoxD [Dyella mobilis]MBM7128993.1 quinol oxidase [Dyella mobilis]GLQ99312.1 quinol oxidase [Dyella mobilis]
MNTSLAIKQNNGFQRAWRLAAIALVTVRFVQGWIYWGGGSRRFLYAPSKLDPNAPHWMAYKFQTAMPGALFGMNHVVSWLLQHFVWLYTSIIIFSAVELLVGIMLITGTLTRLAAACSVGLAFTLMLLFGWQGATCIDEWTMAACNFAMGITLVLAGGGAWSVDSWLARTRPHVASARWFQWLGGDSPLPLSERAFGKLSGTLLAVSVIFIVGTYSYFRGSVVTPFHGGPVSPTAHHWLLSQGQLTQQGMVTFKAYVDAGTPEAPSDVVRATLANDHGEIERAWTAEALASLPKQAFRNDYDYQKIHAGPFGLVGPVGSMATVTLPAGSNGMTLVAGHYTLQLTSVNGRSWTLPLSLP